MAGGNGGEGHAWQGEGMCDGGGVHGRSQERRPLQRAVRILLECILVERMCTLLMCTFMLLFSSMTNAVR